MDTPLPRPNLLDWARAALATQADYALAPPAHTPPPAARRGLSGGPMILDEIAATGAPRGSSAEAHALEMLDERLYRPADQRRQARGWWPDFDTCEDGVCGHRTYGGLVWADVVAEIQANAPYRDG
jgi:hypothetical protein